MTAPDFVALSKEEAGLFTLGGVPEGQDARVLARLASRRTVLHVTIDDARGATLQELIRFFAPEIEVVLFPAWDCLPYDRVSPKPEVMAQRMAALAALLTPARGPRVVITSVAAFLQKLPPPEIFSEAHLAFKAGEKLSREVLQNWLVRNGYNRVATVREPGEFAFRGDIIDLFPPGAALPTRIDLFGEVIESLRHFDPLTQVTVTEGSGAAAGAKAAPALSLLSMGEVFLDEASVARFRSGYRALFGAVTKTDSLYEAISASQKAPGMEHWLPLFHPFLVPLTQYVPDALLTFDPAASEAIRARQQQIADFYEARQSFLKLEKKAQTGAVYKPVPPEQLYLMDCRIEGLATQRRVIQFMPYGISDLASEQAVDAEARRGRDFAEVRAAADRNLYDVFREHVGELARNGRRAILACYSAGSRERLSRVLQEHGVENQMMLAAMPANPFPPGVLGLTVLPLEHGFSAPDLAVLTEQDLLGDRLQRGLRKRKRADAFLLELSSLSMGDLVVHGEHGVGRYDGLLTLEVAGAPHDCLRIVYEGGDRLYLPVENLDLLTRFGADGGQVSLDKLGGAGWQQRKARVKKRLKDMAEALLGVAAARALREADIAETDSGSYAEFCARFPYPETEDQAEAISQTLIDLAAGKPMDRLVCGDVGFGKTEVALRAAYVAAQAGWQVAVVVPTTLLARQHYRNFSSRFAGFPFKVVQLSRFVSVAEARETKAALAAGDVQIVIGTHALLAADVAFKHLGLVILDEEQHFGVKQKERLKQLRAEVHVLTLTATPIPRTLQLALTGVRDLSLITTPPLDRLAVRTFILPEDPVVLREAILREHFRGGQIFYVCPRIEDLPKVEERLRALVPEIKLQTAHGQMPPGRLDEVMTAFDAREFDLLLSTHIVESGLDIPNANTMIIHRADLFGLAQLYQLRGRIGRGKLRGYAYLTWPSEHALSESAQQRLQVMETLDTLGAGFQLASHDLDLRGAGNLLGEEQSGHIREVGIELYQQMLQEAVATAKAGAQANAREDGAMDWSPQIQLGLAVMIPETYVADLNVRMTLYRRLSELKGTEEVEAFAAELIDRFGPYPDEVQNLLDTVSIKLLCRAAGVSRVEAGPKGMVLTFHANSFAKPEKLIEWLSRQGGLVRLRPDHRLISLRGAEEAKARVKVARSLMQELASLAA